MSTYREQAPDTATVDELLAEVDRLRAAASQKASREERREKRREWRKRRWDEHGWILVPVVIIAAFVMLTFVLARNFAAYDRDFRDAEFACMPGWIERRVTGDYQYKYGDNRVICTDGEKRWVVER